MRIVDQLILDHPLRHAFLALGFLQAYVVPQLLKGPAWRPPHSVAVAAFAFAVLSLVDLGLGLQLPAAKRDLIVGLFVVAMLIGGWACVALLRFGRRVVEAAHDKRALPAAPH
ncbi:hypothetical protein [Luteitalea sp.]